MLTKAYSTLPRAPEQKPHHWMQFSVMHRIALFWMGGGISSLLKWCSLYLYFHSYHISYDKNKWINQTLTIGLVEIFCSLVKEELLQTKENISTKPIVSVWFIHFPTYLDHLNRIDQNLPFFPYHDIYIYIYKVLLNHFFTKC